MQHAAIIGSLCCDRPCPDLPKRQRRRPRGYRTDSFHRSMEVSIASDSWKCTLFMPVGGMSLRNSGIVLFVHANGETTSVGLISSNAVVYATNKWLPSVPYRQKSCHSVEEISRPYARDMGKLCPLNSSCASECAAQEDGLFHSARHA